MGRPKGSRIRIGMKRVRINTTVASETWRRIQLAKKAWESLGQVIDRWADRAAKGADPGGMD